MRPLGVTLVALYQILRGVIGLTFGLFVLGFDGPMNKLVSIAARGNHVERLVGHFAHGGGLILGFFALVHLIAGYGLFKMENWGRFLTMLFCAVELVLELPVAIQANVFSIVFGGLNGLCILYLAMPPVKRAFGAQRGVVRMAV
jgi:hypothetical protein